MIIVLRPIDSENYDHEDLVSFEEPERWSISNEDQRITELYFYENNAAVLIPSCKPNTCGNKKVCDTVLVHSF